MQGNLYSPESGDLVMEGGVKIAFSRDEVKTYSENILGNILVTIQTGESGKLVRNLYIESGCDIAHEYYLALLVDREKKSVMIMASTEGGMDIEEVAHNTPELIHRISVDPNSADGIPKQRFRYGFGYVWQITKIIHENVGKNVQYVCLKRLYDGRD